MSDDNVDKTDLNKKDINHLEEKMDNISSEIERLDGNTPSKDDFQDLKDTIDKILLEGNGSEPLTAKVSNNETKLVYCKKRLKWLYGLITISIGSGLTFILENFTKLF